MPWIVHARYRGEPRSYVFDGVALAPASSEGHPDTLGRTDAPLAVHEGMAFFGVPQGASMDLEVQRGASVVRLVHVNLARKWVVPLPDLDALAMLTGDIGAPVPRRIRLISLRPIRAALDAGEPELDAEDLDGASVIALQYDIEIEQEGFMIGAVRGAPEFFCAWNVPRADPPLMKLAFVRLPWVPGMRLGMARPDPSPIFKVDRFWMNAVSASVQPDGVRRLSMMGVVRKGTNFHMGVRLLDTTMPFFRAALREPNYAEHVLGELLLRNAGSLERSLVYPDHQGYLVAVENAQRARQLVRVSIGAKVELRVVSTEPVPTLLALVERAEVGAVSEAATEVPNPTAPSPAPVPSPASESVAMTPVPNTPPALPASSLPVLAPPAALMPSAPSAVRETVTVVVEPPGTTISLGHYAPDAAIWPRVYIVGDGTWAELRWWVSQAGRDGALVPYQLHLQCARRLVVRVAV